MATASHASAGQRTTWCRRLRRFVTSCLRIYLAVLLLLFLLENKLSDGRRLFDAAPTSDKQFLVFDGLGHNDYPPDDYYERLREFVDRVSTVNR
ncbi:MAG: hypothetical protein ABI614_17755 [Planctomycetota bacterium]